MANYLRETLRVMLQREADMVFLALAIWREARGEPSECQVAIGYVVLNRVKRPSWWGKDISSVIFKRFQFSSLTSPKDPQLTTWPQESNDPSWVQALEVANEVVCSMADNPVPGADSYFDIGIPAPAWAKPSMFVKQIGRVRFFNTDCDHERGSG